MGRSWASVGLSWALVGPNLGPFGNAAWEVKKKFYKSPLVRDLEEGGILALVLFILTTLILWHYVQYVQ